MGHRTYGIYVLINGIRFTQLEIDDHYELNHSDHMTDRVIVALIYELSGQDYGAAVEYDDGLRIFVVEPIFHEGKPYRLVWFYYSGSHTLTVRTAFRARRKK